MGGRGLVLWERRGACLARLWLIVSASKVVRMSRPPKENRQVDGSRYILHKAPTGPRLLSLFFPPSSDSPPASDIPPHALFHPLPRRPLKSPGSTSKPASQHPDLPHSLPATLVVASLLRHRRAVRAIFIQVSKAFHLPS
ncbi:hypothetical protein K402DRAFT_45191 [Aulographum hederae CBS 113979]|uniref:Uncharacterized protein n=1 Tax=Aulographum hederae CBS 113979 TaxID=1176131 RepID=A0A6G1H3I1_9PEZI|nr:hypothetical protein K402DRAFT_45191 [Aulographum hederae CBS 113979]